MVESVGDALLVVREGDVVSCLLGFCSAVFHGNGCIDSRKHTQVIESVAKGIGGSRELQELE